MTFVNISTYKFIKLKKLLNLQAMFLQLCLELELKGTIILSQEGINIALSGTRVAVDHFYNQLSGNEHFSNLMYKESLSTLKPFRRLLVKIKPEIITMGQSEIRPEIDTVPHLSPLVFKKWLDNNDELAILDTRNHYEVKAGTFENAINLSISQFTEFPKAFLNYEHNFDKTKPLVMFCTGGIRCEKAGIIAKQCGFSDVYQLAGGVLGYFQACGGAYWQGECFVFDDRVAVDVHLNPSTKGYCPNCVSVLPDYSHLPPYERLKFCQCLNM